MAITRKVFLLQLASGGWVLAGCGGGGYGGAPAASAGVACAMTIAGNHGHTLSISAADLNSGGFTRDITGTADHAHSVTFSAADLTQLTPGYNTVPPTILSSMSLATATFPAHTHAISGLCA